MKPIPIKEGKRLIEMYGYDQVVIVARAIGKGEHVTTYGIDSENCAVAAQIGDFLKYKVMGWANESGK